MAAARKVELFYDVLSPYSWFGFEVILRYQTKWNIALKLRPFSLPRTMMETGVLPPAANNIKNKYIAKDLNRLRNYYQVPVRLPNDFIGEVVPKGSLVAQRLLTAVALDTPENLEDISRAFWMRVWNQDKDITKPESFLEGCIAAGFSKAEAKNLIERAKDQDVKDVLNDTTEEAVRRGIFGAPTFLVEDPTGKKQMVFGSDRFHQIAQILGEKYEGPLNELARTTL